MRRGGLGRASTCRYDEDDMAFVDEGYVAEVENALHPWHVSIGMY